MFKLENPTAFTDHPVDTSDTTTQRSLPSFDVLIADFLSSHSEDEDDSDEGEVESEVEMESSEDEHDDEEKAGYNLRCVCSINVCSGVRLSLLTFG